MTAYILANWIFCCSTALLLIYILANQRYLLVKPSIVVIFLFHILIQWAATIKSPEIEEFLPQPLAFFALVQLFPLIALSGSLMYGLSDSQLIWQRLQNLGSEIYSPPNRFRVVLTLTIVIFTVYYLIEIPFAQTGLYAVLFDPTRAAIAREESLKLVNNPIIRYGFQIIMGSVVAPMLIVLLLDDFWDAVQRQLLVRVVIIGLCTCILLVATNLSGARSFAAFALIAGIYAQLLKRKLVVNLGIVALGFVSIAVIPTALTILREGIVFDFSTFTTYLMNATFERTFITPMETGLYYVHYAQTVGEFGVAAIPRLAELVGLASVDPANIIGLRYYNYNLDSITANACYVMTYYGYFGLISIPLSLLGLWSLDLMLIVFSKLDHELLLMTVSVTSLAGIRFVSADFTTSLLTGGFLAIPLAVLLLKQFQHSKVIDEFSQNRLVTAMRA